MGELDRRGCISLFGVNLVFLFTAILLVTLGYYLQTKNIYSGLLITEFVLILVPPVFYVMWKGAGLKKVFRLKKVSPGIIGLCALITVSAYPLGLFLNILGNFLLSLLGRLMPMPIPVADTLREYCINIVVIALSAAIAEEMFFRGLILKGYERLGYRKAIAISALLFGVFHFNIQNFLGPVFLGFVFGYMVVRTDSIFPAITGHFINNGLSVTMAFLAKVLSGETGEAVQKSLSSSALLAALVFWGVIAFIAGNIMFRLLKRLEQMTDSTLPDGFQGECKVGFKELIPVGLTLLIFVYMAVRELIFIIGSK